MAKTADTCYIWYGMRMRCVLMHSCKDKPCTAQLICVLQGKYGNLDASVVSYGPCQTPTLNFCVERHQKIASFQPEPFWVVRPHVSKGGQSIALEWGRGRLFDLDVAQMFKRVVSDGQQLKVSQ